MPHPPKIGTLCESLKCYIDLHFSPGGKLPPERVLCKIMGCSSRTLGTAMRKLVEEKRIVRSRKGSFVCGGSCSDVTDEALTVLLPCSDFSFSGSARSRLSNHQMIQGALAAAKKYQRRVITIPVTDSNDPQDINPMQLSQLGPGSMVMFQSQWYEPLFPLFWERKCRLAFLNCGTSYTPEMIPPGIDCFMLAYTDYQTRLFEKSLEWFSARGAKRIAAAFCENDPKVAGQSKALARFAGKLKRHLWPGNPDYLQFTAWLKHLYAKEKFDALLLYPPPDLPCDPEIDFYEQTSIPPSLPLLISESALVKQSRIAEHAGVISIPTIRYCMEAADFLLSGQHGVKYSTAEYQIEPAGQYSGIEFR